MAMQAGVNVKENTAGIVRGRLLSLTVHTDLVTRSVAIVMTNVLRRLLGKNITACKFWGQPFEFSRKRGG